jgi:hypothetical protein
MKCLLPGWGRKASLMALTALTFEAGAKNTKYVVLHCISITEIRHGGHIY